MKHFEFATWYVFALLLGAGLLANTYSDQPMPWPEPVAETPAPILPDAVIAETNARKINLAPLPIPLPPIYDIAVEAPTENYVPTRPYHAMKGVPEAYRWVEIPTPAGMTHVPRSSLSMVTPARAYPSAEGWGADATVSCVRDTAFSFTVTSLAGSSGVGTLDSILSHIAPDTMTYIFYDLGGWGSGLNWVSTGAAKLDCLYIAMQTAPGGGVGYRSRFRMLRVGHDSEDFILRGGTFAGTARDDDTSTPSMSIENATSWIWSENEWWWSIEKALALGAIGTTDTMQNISILNSIFAQANKIESTPIQISFTNAAQKLSRFSWGGNVFSSNSHRNPNHTTTIGVKNSPSSDTVPRTRFVGNIVYNWLQATAMGGGFAIDLVDQFNKAGPMNDSRYPWSFGVEGNGDSAADDSTFSLYVERIIGVNNTDTLTSADSLWADGGTFQEIACYYRACRNPGGGGDPRVDTLVAGPVTHNNGIGPQIKRDTAQKLPSVPLSRVNPTLLADLLFGTATDSGTVGAYRQIQCDGTFTFRSDSMHSAILKEARDGTGIGSASTVDSAFVKARELYSKPTGTACPDLDNDDLPDAFELRATAGATDSTSADCWDDPDLDGWIHCDEYANGTDPRVFTTAGAPGGSVICSWNRRCIRRVPAKDSLIILGIDTLGIVLWVDPDSVPVGISADFYRDSLATLARVLVVTCDSVVGGAIGLDSVPARDSAIVMGLDPDSLMALTPPGC